MKSSAVAFSLLLAVWSTQSFGQSTPTETVEGDRKWEADITNGPCSKLKDRLTDKPSDIAACEALYANQPRCLVYKGSAQIWFDMRTTNDPVLAYQPQMIAGLGQGNDKTLANKSPEFRGQLQRLLSATLKIDQAQLKTGAKWGELAYSRCMAGKFL